MYIFDRFEKETIKRVKHRCDNENKRWRIEKPW